MKVSMLVQLLLMGVVSTVVRGEPCLEQTRPHATRCDQFFRCVLLPSETHVWVPTQCAKGLIYEPQLKTCVLPGNDWECDLSAEVGNESGENVYGINNLPAAFYTGPTIQPLKPTTTLYSEKVSFSSGVHVTTEQPAPNLPTIDGDHEGYYIVLDRDGNNRTTIYRTSDEHGDDEGEEEFSGDGQLVEMELTTVSSAENSHGLHSLVSGASEESSELSPNELNSFLAEYKIKTSSETLKKPKRKHPLPADGKIHPDHLMAILNQQKKLNSYASQIKQKEDPTGGIGDKSPFSDQPVFTNRPGGSVMFNVPQRVTAESHTKTPLMSEDVIRSIIEISKQMMTNHKPHLEEMYVKPIFIPVSVSSSTQDYNRLPDKPTKVMFHQMFPSLSNNTSQFSAKPIGITITNPYTLGQATIYDNLRDQVLNDSQYYTYQATVMDAYGNRYPSQQPMPNVQIFPYPPTMTYPSYSQQNFPYPNANAYYNQPELTNRLRNTLGYQNDNSSSNENALSEEEDDASADTPEADVPDLNNSPTSNEENVEYDEHADMKKLISVGGITLNYQDYKDSILPLLDANPDEVRISVLTCTLGSRQPNKTDCTKYYVCNPHNGAFQSFTCPSFTAFNAETRICDTATYKDCLNKKPTIMPTTQPTMLTRLADIKLKNQLTTETSQLKHDLMTAHKYVDLIKKQAIKILSRNKLTTESTSGSSTLESGTLGISNPTMSSFSPSITAPNIPSTAATKRRKTKPKRKPSTSHGKKRTKATSKSAGLRASSTTTTTTTTTPAPVPKAPKCKRNGKMPDPAEKHNYYVCYKANPKKFIKTRMACPNRLVYCANTEYCTHEKECKKQ
ncbi:uncharacterized protein LOC131683099 [Topomyia yanbarensis]|uniref:uncharacterized protein LOC131683099 n=1 Tax=Topomyia yanbarensis TaxID=2498891 RepID=UPI00273C9BE4|nr:uncharacterized protein LOC131683099 [Topomyia yanbarensis]